MSLACQSVVYQNMARMISVAFTLTMSNASFDEKVIWNNCLYPFIIQLEFKYHSGLSLSPWSPAMQAIVQYFDSGQTWILDSVREVFRWSVSSGSFVTCQTVEHQSWTVCMTVDWWSADSLNMVMSIDKDSVKVLRSIICCSNDTLWKSCPPKIRL